MESRIPLLHIPNIEVSNPLMTSSHMQWNQSKLCATGYPFKTSKHGPVIRCLPRNFEGLENQSFSLDFSLPCGVKGSWLLAQGKEGENKVNWLRLAILESETYIACQCITHLDSWMMNPISFFFLIFLLGSFFFFLFLFYVLLHFCKWTLNCAMV